MSSISTQDSTITGLPGVSSLTGTELFPVDQGTTTKHATINQVVAGNLIASFSTTGTSIPSITVDCTALAPTNGTTVYDGLRFISPPSTASIVKSNSPNIRLTATNWTGSASIQVECLIRHNVAASGPGSYVTFYLQGTEVVRIMSGDASTTGSGIRIASQTNNAWLQLYNTTIESGAVINLNRSSLGGAPEVQVMTFASPANVKFGGITITPSTIPGIWFLGDVAIGELTNAAAGDFVFRSGNSLRFANNAGTSALSFIASNSSDQLILGSGATDLKWGKALVALGGGASATLGTIGATGPSTAGQNTWMRVIDSTGAAFWVPAWK